MAPLHVCHVIHSLGPGGAEDLLVELAATAEQSDLALSVLTLTPVRGDGTARALAEFGVEVRQLPFPSRWDPRSLSAGLAAIRALSPTLLHTHLKHADLVGAYASSRLGIPLVSTLHLVEDAPTLLGCAKLRLASQARVRRATYTIAVSDAVRSWYLAATGAHPAKVVTVRNGVRMPAALQAAGRRELRRALGVPDSAVLAMTVGVMRPGKGHEVVVRLAQMVPAELDVRFVLVGDGPLRRELERAAASLPDGLVTFTGFRRDVPALLAAADLQVHPSGFDALPTALIHGLAAGVPAVATAVGGIPEVVTPETGRLVPAHDSAAVAAAVTELARHPGLRARLGAAARHRFETEFEVSQWASRLRQVYEAAQAAQDARYG